MDQITFDRMVMQMPHLAPKLVNITYTLIEHTWFPDKPSLFNIVKKENYIKTNGKMCYIQSIVKTIEVERQYLQMPTNFSYYWIVKKKYKDEILKKHLNNYK